jgi:Spy/CpxP family protein refolding chaperone
MRFAKITAVFLMMIAPAFAQGRFMGARRMMAAGQEQFGNLDALKDYLKLTPQQVTDLQAVRSAMRTEVKPMVQALAPKLKALREAMRQDPVDSEAVSKLRKEIDDARSAIRTKRDEFGAKARGMLTADQVSSLQALDQALKLERAAHQAMQAGFIAPPEGADLPGLRGRRK